jgi:hypothetical protein
MTTGTVHELEQPMGILRELEQYRLQKHGPATLERASALVAELLSLDVLPHVVADVLTVHKSDLDRAVASCDNMAAS